MTNIERFNKCVAEILALLYESFPIGFDIEINDYPEYDNSDDSKIFNSTIRFLNDENFIRYEKSVYGGYIGVVLTSKGLTKLTSAIPDILDDKETIGSKIKSILNEGNKEAIRTLIRVFITAI
jgi:hypothetical protein